MIHGPYTKHTPNAEKSTQQIHEGKMNIHKNGTQTLRKTHANTHDNCRNTRSKFIKKGNRKHTHETHTRNAETHAIGSQKMMKILKELHKHTASS